MTPHRLHESALGRFVSACLFLGWMAAVMTSCLNDDNLIGENCYDGVLNNGEELIDCGGPICEPCDPCENEVQDILLGETWVDCGGPNCEPCDVHFNGLLDEEAGELGIDCGCPDCPSCAELCGDGLFNGYEYLDNPNFIPDCGGPDCDACPTCDDLEMNGDETGIDCGGTYCEPCECLCDCTNGIQDGLEDFIDCGGPSCEPCVAEITWNHLGVQYFATDALASAALGDGNLSIQGSSTTGAFVGIVINEPEDGWDDANYPFSVALNQTSIPEAIGYTSEAGTDYTTLLGGNTTVQVSYIDATSGGYLVGSFQGSMFDAAGNSTVLTSGVFTLPID